MAIIEIDPNIKVSDVLKSKERPKTRVWKPTGFSTIKDKFIEAKAHETSKRGRKISITDKVLAESSIRTADQIDEDLSKRLLPLLKRIASGTKSLAYLVYMLRDVHYCEKWNTKLSDLKRVLDTYRYGLEDRVDRSTTRNNMNAVYDAVRALLVEMDPKGFYATIKAEKDELAKLPEIVEQGAAIVLNKSESARTNQITFRTLNRYNQGAMKLMLRQIANRCEELLPNSRFQISLNETNNTLYNVECILNGKRYVTVV